MKTSSVTNVTVFDFLSSYKLILDYHQLALEIITIQLVRLTLQA